MTLLLAPGRQWFARSTILAATCISLPTRIGFSAVANPADTDSVVDGCKSEIVGIPVSGNTGITLTVAEIMALDRDFGPVPLTDEQGRTSPLARRNPDRTRLPQSRGSLAICQWPPTPAGVGGTSHDLRDVERAPHDQQRLSPQLPGVNAMAIQYSDTAGLVPPDTSAAVGPTQILVAANGRIRTLSKSDGSADWALNATTDSFFNAVRGGAAAVQPRVRYDRTSQRWFVSMITAVAPNRVLLAVSSDSTITSSASFTFYSFQFDTIAPTNPSDTGGFLDHATLAVDAQAVYVGGNVFNPNYKGTTGFVIRKTSVLSGGPIIVTVFRQMCTATGPGPYSPSGADNWDPAFGTGFFVGVSNDSLGQISLRRVNSPGGTPILTSNVTVSVPTTAVPIDVAVPGGTTLDGLDDRHVNAQIHRDRVSGATSLWLSHAIKVNSAGVGGPTGNRNGSRWYQIGDLSGTPTLIQAGTLFDTALMAPKSYWFDSVAMSGQGHVALGSTCGGWNDRASAVAAGRLRPDALGVTQSATTLAASSANYFSGPQPWGRYSHTCVDPNDDQTLWTAQTWCNATFSWGIQVVELKAPPPATPVWCTPSVVFPGSSGVDVVVQCASSAGSELYDTDPSYTQRLTAAVSGIGVTVNSVTFNSVTQMTMNIDVSGGATPGARSVTVTNPDQQSRTSEGGILTVDSAPCIAPSIDGHPGGLIRCPGTSATFTVSATGTGPLAYQWRKNTVNIGGATGPSFTITGVAPGDAGSYDCVVTNVCGSNTSSVATLTVRSAPVITMQPAGLAVNEGGTALFTSAAGGSAPLAFQWRKGATPISDGPTGFGSVVSGSNTNALSILNVQGLDAGVYDVIVTNACGSAGSDGAMLEVTVAPLCVPCDANCDGTLNPFDVQPFLDLLGGATPCDACTGDTDGNGTINPFDVTTFLECI